MKEFIISYLSLDEGELFMEQIKAKDQKEALTIALSNVSNITPDEVEHLEIDDLYVTAYDMDCFIEALEL